jgi:signal transduction histidine kinase
MRERLRQVAGTLERDGRQGTRLVMSLPAQGSSS